MASGKINPVYFTNHAKKTNNPLLNFFYFTALSYLSLGFIVQDAVMMIPNTEGRLRIVTEKGQWLQNEELEARTFINTPSVSFLWRNRTNWAYGASLFRFLYHT